MTSSKNDFYECDDPDCRLRFPAFGDQPRWKRCPLCRSSIHLVAISNYAYEADNQVRTQPRWPIEAMLDNIRSAWNVGSIFRSADGTGIQRLYLCGITPSPENSKVSKTALGAETTVPWEHHKNGVQLAGGLKSRGYTLWALEDVTQAIPLFQVELSQTGSPIVLVVGNELSGVDPGILEMCDQVVSIPMLGKKQSYNVAVAFGIAASFLLYRQSVSQESLKIFPKT